MSSITQWFTTNVPPIPSIGIGICIGMADVQITVYLGILVARKIFSWQKISRIFTALCQNWTNFPWIFSLSCRIFYETIQIRLFLAKKVEDLLKFYNWNTTHISMRKCHPFWAHFGARTSKMTKNQLFYILTCYISFER